MAEVLVDSGEGWGTGPAKVLIVEPLQNVPPETKEVQVDTSSGSSCYRRLQAGQRYVLITDGAPYSISGCNPSFAVAGKEHILDAMREQLRGGLPRLVGKVRRSTGPYSEEGAIAGAVVELIKGGFRRTATTDSEGTYAMAGLEPGRYEISVRKDRFVANAEANRRWSGRMAFNPRTKKLEPVQSVPGEIEIMPSSCEIRDLAMWPAGSIRGTVRGADRKPIQGVSVQAFQLNRKESVSHRPCGRRSLAPTAATGSNLFHPGRT